MSHMPVCGWLRPAAAWLKRSVNALTQGWDDETHDVALREHIDYVARRVARDDPARGRWCVSGECAVVWTDASSIATGVVIESTDGNVLEDGCWPRCWLRREDTTHINMAELDAMVRGVNLAIAWNMTKIHLKTDSATVHRWVEDALTGRTRLRTKAQGEMLIRRRVDLIRQLKDEMGLDLTAQLVPSAQNHADKLTRVPSDWIRSWNGAVEQRAADSTEHDSDSNDARRVKQVTREQAMHEDTVETVADEALERDVSAASAGAMIAVAAAENRKPNLIWKPRRT